jgi:hypothetical protein
MKVNKNLVTEEFDIDPYQGAMVLATITKPGFRLISIKRKGSKAILTFEKVV